MREKLVTLNVYVSKEEKSQINNKLPPQEIRAKQ